MTNECYSPFYYRDEQQLRASMHWHSKRIGEMHVLFGLPKSDYDQMLKEMLDCGMTDLELEDQFGISWVGFLYDYYELFRLTRTF